MVNFCSAYDCGSASDVYPNIMFHKFPLNDERRLKMWLHAIKRKNFKPTISSKVCSLHFTENDYNPPVISGPLRLKADAVPSIFSFTAQLLPRSVSGRQSPIQITPNQVHEETVAPIPLIGETSKKDIAVQTVLTGIELTETLFQLRRDKQCLQKQLQRRNQRINSMKNKIQLTVNNLLEESTEDIMKGNCHSSLPFELYENEIHNSSNATTTNQCYSEDI